MTWNYAPELISALFLLVILSYSVRFRMVPNRRNRLFVIMTSLVLGLIVLSVATVQVSGTKAPVSSAINLLIHTLFFLTYPIIPVLFLWYLIAVAYEQRDRLISTLMIVTYTPKLIYDVIVLVNPFTDFIFHITPDSTYVPKSGEGLIFGIALLYLIFILVFAILYRKVLSRQLTFIIATYIGIFIVFLIIQYLVPSLVLSGTASTLFILILYLYIQNKEILTDRLTNLMNRPAAIETLRLLDRTQESAQLILISLSDFRTVNGLYGQQFGDALLKDISDFLIALSSQAEVYRYSGDMFLLILKEDPEKAEDVLQQIMDRFKRSFTVNGTSTSLRAKFVFAQYPKHVQSSENAVALLEFLIARAKQDSKENLHRSSEDSLQEMNRRSRVLEIIRKAVDNDSFTIALQPIYSVKDQSFTKAEALLRLTDEQVGVISPAEFIPLAEEAGLIIQIGRLVTRKTVNFIRQCNDNGIFLDSISVNYAANHISQAKLVEEILKLVDQERIFPSQLKIEITESIFIGDYSQTIANINALNKAGIGVYLDDFGTGFSNLASVVKLPLEMIKFDRSLILEASVNETSRGMVKGLTNTFKLSGFQTVAEGVETLAQEQMVIGMCFDHVQGYLKSKPLSPKEFLIFMQLNAKKSER